METNSNRATMPSNRASGIMYDSDQLEDPNSQYYKSDLQILHGALADRFLLVDERDIEHPLIKRFKKISDILWDKIQSGQTAL